MMPRACAVKYAIFYAGVIGVVKAEAMTVMDEEEGSP
jgi:hypothetical protein